MTCTCSKLSLGDAYNWNPYCAKHGTTSEWYGSPEQAELRRQRDQDLRILQTIARLRRSGLRLSHICSAHRYGENLACTICYDMDNVAEVLGRVEVRPEILKLLLPE